MKGVSRDASISPRPKSGGVDRAAQFALLRARLLALIDSIADREADLTSMKTKPVGYSAEMAMLFAHRAALQDQIPVIRRAERLTSDARPVTCAADLRKVAAEIQAALILARRDENVPEATEVAVKAITRLSAALQGPAP